VDKIDPSGHDGGDAVAVAYFGSLCPNS